MFNAASLFPSFLSLAPSSVETAYRLVLIYYLLLMRRSAAFLPVEAVGPSVDSSLWLGLRLLCLRLTQ